MLHKPAVWFILLLLLLVTVCVLFAGTASPSPFAYDESDYMFAGTQGVWANFTDRGTMSFVEFVRKGLELSHDPSRRGGMSQFIRSTGDLAFYRHYHGPVYAYWISLCKVLGVQSEAGYRGSGMVLHALGAIALFWLFRRALPELPVAAAFVGAAGFALNRTTLLTGTVITQHIPFEVLAFLSLFAFAIYCQSGNIRWWYATAVLVACSFAAVEISSVLIGAVVLSLLLTQWKDGFKNILVLLGKGTLAFLATLLVIWPKGLLQLDFAKGYLYLAYMAIYRKTFSPIGPRELWSFKLKTYPLEFVAPLLVLLLLLVFWRKLLTRTAAVPFLVYACMFLGVTMVVTIPYSHYNGSLLASLAVLVGIGFGEFWQRTGPVGRGLAMTVLLGTQIAQANLYYHEAMAERNQPTFRQNVLEYLNQTRTAGPMYVSYVLIPTLHFYHPEITAVGYDGDWTVRRLAEESLAAAPARVLCPEKLCEQLVAAWPPGTASPNREPAGHTDETGESVYALSLTK